MAWEGQMIEMVRVLVDDMSTSPRYDDSKLERALIVSAYQVIQDNQFNTTYAVDIMRQTITPDPTDGDQDYNFVNLWVLKTRCLILSGEFKVQAMQAISVKNGPSSIDMGGSANSIKILAEQACAAYENYKLNYMAGNVGKAILTPYSPGGDSVGADMYGHRGRYFDYRY